MKRKILSFLAVLMVSLTALAAENSDRTSFVPLLGDLSDGRLGPVNDILQDSRGYLWIGTLDGLVQYDGKNLRFFRRSELHLRSSAISALFEDSAGNVWVGTEYGLCRYDQKAGRFISVDAEADNGVGIISKVNCIKEDSDGLIWISLKGMGICSYDPRADRLENFLYDPESGDIPLKIQNFLIDDNGDFILAVYFDGLYFCSRDFSTVRPMRFDGLSLSGDNITSMSLSDNNSFYVTSARYGLCEMFVKTGKSAVLIPMNGYYPLDMYSSGSAIFMTTDHGLYSYDTSRKEYVFHNSVNSPGLEVDKLLAVTVDSRGSIVVTDSFGGIYYNSPESQFISIFDRTEEGEMLSGASVSGFASDDEGNIWVASYRGLYVVSGRSHHLTRSRIVAENAPCYAVCFSGGWLWVSTDDGIYRSNPKTGKTIRYTVAQTGILSMRDRKIYPIKKEENGKLLLGHALGVTEYDPVTDSFRQLPGMGEFNVNGIAMESDTEIWLSTYAHGLLKYDLKNECTVPFPQENLEWVVMNKRLNDVYMDGNHRLWVASNEDGCLVLSADGSTSFLKIENTFGILESDNILGIQEDYFGTIWLSTKSGLTSVSSDMKTMVHYGEKDGLLNNSFSKRSGFTSPEGMVYLGSYDGFISFTGREMGKRSSANPGLYISDMSIGNKSVTFDLGENIDIMSKVVLKPDENNISFTISRPVLPSSSDGYAICKLEGADKDWHTLDAGNRISWRSLPSGKYKLLLKSFSNDGSFENEHDPLVVVIRRRPLESTLARAFYLIAVLLLLFYGGRKLYRHYLEKEMRRQRELIESQIASTPERKLLRAAQIGMSPYTVLNESLKEKDRRILDGIESIIEEHILDKDLSYGLVADELCMGKQNLNLKFKALVGITVNDYIRLYRLCKAVRMISDDDVRINEICYQVGFNTPSYFAKCFKATFGILPAEYKDRLHG